MVRESPDVDVAELRRRVTSKGGTTQAALDVMHAARWTDVVADAVSAAVKRAGELSRE